MKTKAEVSFARKTRFNVFALTESLQKSLLQSVAQDAELLHKRTWHSKGEDREFDKVQSWRRRPKCCMTERQMQVSLNSVFKNYVNDTFVFTPRSPEPFDPRFQCVDFLKADTPRCRTYVLQLQLLFMMWEQLVPNACEMLRAFFATFETRCVTCIEVDGAHIEVQRYTTGDHARHVFRRFVHSVAMMKKNKWLCHVSPLLKIEHFPVRIFELI